MNTSGTSPVPVVVVTGLSGSGKSTALKVFEDLRFFCVDGLPASMVPKLVTLFKQKDEGAYKGIALGMDVRQLDFSDEWNRALEEMAAGGLEINVLFLEARIDELLRRYAETRRLHPLEGEGLGLKQALEKESEALEPVRSLASLVIDTSHYSIHDLRRKIQEQWSCISTLEKGLRVHLISFGFKYGVPKEADLIFDMRFLPNPHFEPNLRPMSGQDKPVADYVLKSGVGSEFMVRFLDFMKYLLPQYAQEGRYRLTIGIGCTGGRHRSVAVAERLYATFHKEEYPTTIEHRHMELA